MIDELREIFLMRIRRYSVPSNPFNLKSSKYIIRKGELITRLKLTFSNLCSLKVLTFDILLLLFVLKGIIAWNVKYLPHQVAKIYRLENLNTSWTKFDLSILDSTSQLRPANDEASNLVSFPIENWKLRLHTQYRYWPDHKFQVKQKGEKIVFKFSKH